MNTSQCFHCGNDIIKKEEVFFDAKSFFLTVVK
jgi:hypothetical protein